MILANTPIRVVLRPGNITNTMEVMVGDIEWFSALVKMQAKLRDVGKLVLGLETMVGKSAQDVATTVVAVSAVIPVTDSERTKVDTLIQIEQTALLQSLQLNAVAVGLRALRADPRFAPKVNSYNSKFCLRM